MKGSDYLYVEHAGAPAARNVGLANAKGDLIAYLDDDNVMHPGWLKAVAGFSSWPQTEVLYGARIIEDDLAHEAARSGDLPSMSFDPWDRRRLESSNYVDQNVIAHRAGLPGGPFRRGTSNVSGLGPHAPSDCPPPTA